MSVQTYEVIDFQPINAAKKSAVVLFLPLLMTVGTGGAFNAQNAKAAEGWFSPIQVEQPTRRKIAARSPAEHVAFIRDALGLNMSDLANVLGATRPTAYAWLEGQEPKAETLLHIHNLSRVAEEVARLEIPRMDKYVRRPIFNGKSLLDKLKTNEDPTEFLEILKSVAEQEMLAHKTPKGSGNYVRPLSEVARDFSKPYSSKG